MGDVVAPILPSSTQLDPDHSITIRARNHVFQHLIHTILSPVSPWNGGRASTRRCCDLSPPPYHTWSSNSSTPQIPWLDHIFELSYPYSILYHLPRVPGCLECFVLGGEVSFSSSPLISSLAIDPGLQSNNWRA